MSGLKILMGLGNPGSAYRNHRHNVGYWLIDYLVDSHQLVEKEKPGYFYYEWNHDFGKTYLLKSKSYMNESGMAFSKMMRFYKYMPSDCWVVYDEMDFLPGVARVKKGGGAGGHNGVKSLIQHAGPDFHRLRLGVGRPSDPSEVRNYVLSVPRQEERKNIEEAMSNALASIDLLLKGQYDAYIEKLHQR